MNGNIVHTPMSTIVCQRDGRLAAGGCGKLLGVTADATGDISLYVYDSDATPDSSSTRGVWIGGGDRAGIDLITVDGAGPRRTSRAKETTGARLRNRVKPADRVRAHRLLGRRRRRERSTLHLVIEVEGVTAFGGDKTFTNDTRKVASQRTWLHSPSASTGAGRRGRHALASCAAVVVACRSRAAGMRSAEPRAGPGSCCFTASIFVLGYYAFFLPMSGAVRVHGVIFGIVCIAWCSLRRSPRSSRCARAGGVIRCA